MSSGPIGSAEAESYLTRAFFNAAFFSAYTLAGVLLYQRRANGDWETEGSLRRIISLNDSKRRISAVSLLLGDYSELFGALNIVLLVAVAVWLYGEAQRIEIAVFATGILVKHCLFNSTLLQLNLNFFSYQGLQITKLPVISPRGRKSNVLHQAPDPSEGEVTTSIVSCYGLAAISILAVTNMIPYLTGHGAAMLNLADDPVNVFKVKSASALFMELLTFFVLTTWLAKLFLSVNLLCLILKQRLNAIRNCVRISALSDFLQLSDQRLESSEALLCFSLISPLTLVVVVIVFDILRLAGVSVAAHLATYDPTIAHTAVWCVSFPMSLIATKVVWLAVKGAETWKEKEREIFAIRDTETGQDVECSEEDREEVHEEEDCSEDDEPLSPASPSMTAVLKEILTRTDSRATVTAKILPGFRLSLNRTLFYIYSSILTASLVLRVVTLRHFSN